MLDLLFELSYNECESKCDDNESCMSFEYCPHNKMCRLFDARTRRGKSLEQKQWYNCYANYATCKKGNMASIRNFTSIMYSYSCEL